MTVDSNKLDTPFHMRIIGSMDNIRLLHSNPKVHPHFTIRHAHLSRISEQELQSLRTVSDFCIGQINGKVAGVDVVSGSQYFIEDHTEEKKVRSIFEASDRTGYDRSVINGVVSYSREDIVNLYKQNEDL